MWIIERLTPPEDSVWLQWAPLLLCSDCVPSTWLSEVVCVFVTSIVLLSRSVSPVRSCIDEHVRLPVLLRVCVCVCVCGSSEDRINTYTCMCESESMSSVLCAGLSLPSVLSHLIISALLCLFCVDLVCYWCLETLFPCSRFTLPSLST